MTKALISELDDSEVKMTALLPGPADTDFFNKAGAEERTVAKEGDLADPASVAKDGYEAMQSGDSKVISGWKNEIQGAMGNLMTNEMPAKMSKKQDKPSDK